MQLSKQELEQLVHECFEEVRDLLYEAGFKVLPQMELSLEYPTTGYYEDSYGSYPSMSQFKGKLKIRVYPDNVLRLLIKKVSLDNIDLQRLKEEVQVTIAHEFGHSMCEVYEVLEQNYQEIQAPKWNEVYDDEEDFVEEFAQMLVSGQLDEVYRSVGDYVRHFWPNLLKTTIQLYSDHIHKEEV